MATRYFALLLGVFLLGSGICGFIPGLVTPAPIEPDSLAINAGYGYLFGLFPTNIVFNLVRSAFGVWGILAYSNETRAWYYAVAIAVIYSVFAAFGILPVTGTMFGLAPIFGNNIFLHAGSALLAGYFAFVRRSPEVAVGTTAEQR